MTMGIAGIEPATAQVQRAQSVPREQLQTLRSALDQLERGQPDNALAAIKPLTEADTHPIISHTAKLLQWQLTGGIRSHLTTYHNRGVLPVVVLVPDEAAFLEALQGWSEQLFYPILIEDGWYTPIFVQRFQPKVVVRWSKTVKPTEPDKLRQALEQRIAQHNRGFTTPSDPAPPGLVVIDPDDPQRMAGLALAIGKAQPIHAWSQDGRVNESAKPEQVEQWNSDLYQALNQAGLCEPGRWCGLTLAGAYPLRYAIKQGDKTHYLAVDDRLGRAPNGLRVAATGRLWGDAAQSVYMAMGALFLQPTRALMFDDYSNRQGAFQSYRLESAETALRPIVPVQRVSGKDVSPLALRLATRTGEPVDLLWINTSGGATSMSMSGSAIASDLPCDRAFVFYLIHSYSARSPWQHNTIAGWAMGGGAYWMFGSVHEPYLTSFVQPTGMAHKIAAGTPFAFAARQMPGTPMARPWKLAAFGDPLYALRPSPANRQPVRPIAYTRAINEKRSADDLSISFHNALLTDADRALPLARLVLKQPEIEDRSDLKRAAWTLYQNEQYQELAVIKPDKVRTSYLAQWVVWRSGLMMFDKSADARSARAAQLMLQRLLEMGMAEKPLAERIDRWMNLAGGDKAKPAIRAFLEAEAKKKLPRLSRNVLQAALAKLDEPKQTKKP